MKLFIMTIDKFGHHINKRNQWQRKKYSTLNLYYMNGPIGEEEAVKKKYVDEELSTCKKYINQVYAELKQFAIDIVQLNCYRKEDIDYMLSRLNNKIIKNDKTDNRK